MDISDDLCRADFFDLVPMGLDAKFGDASSHSLTPVALIDSSDYMQSDGNNNLISGTTGHIKSFLDEMFLSDSLNHGDPSQVGLASSTFEVLGTFQWSADGTTTNSTTSSGDGDGDDSPPSDPSWLLNPGFNSDGEVTTLTNLIDPLFVTYEDEHGGSVTTKIEQYLGGGGESRVVSSDLITSTFLNEATSGGDHSPTEVSSQSSSESDLISWQKSSDGLVGGSSLIHLCDDSLLRSALQSGNNNNSSNSGSNPTNLNGTKVVKLTAIVSASSSSMTTNNQMTELRKVLSFPPLTSPTSSTPDGHSQSSSEALQQPYSYELKVIDPAFADDNIPDVEELIMTRIDPSFGGYHQQTILKDGSKQKKLGEISERKINSTTLSTKWTYTTNHGNDPGKTPRRRKKKNLLKMENGGDPYSPTNSSSNNNKSISNSSSGGSPNSHQSSGGTPTNGIRKERSLHYCNICCKGFKDKYSVNVHVRTHTGEKPFSCNLCGKNFRQKAHLAKHNQTHQNRILKKNG